MSRLKIIVGADRLGFSVSLLTVIDGIPCPGYMSRPHSRGGDIPPTYRGERFLTQDDAGKRRELPLIITAAKKVGRGEKMAFEAILWGDCDEFRDFLIGPVDAWVYFHGEYEFQSLTGWLERINPDA